MLRNRYCLDPDAKERGATRGNSKIPSRPRKKQVPNRAPVWLPMGGGAFVWQPAAQETPRRSAVAEIPDSGPMPQELNPDLFRHSQLFHLLLCGFGIPEIHGVELGQIVEWKLFEFRRLRIRLIYNNGERYDFGAFSFN